MKAATRPGQQNPPKFEFQSTPPVKAATLCNTDRVRACRISIHAPREGGDRKKSNNTANNSISIHAAREGGDLINRIILVTVTSISIHAAREGGDYKKR